MNPFDEGTHGDDVGTNPFGDEETQDVDTQANSTNPFGEDEEARSAAERSSGNKRISLPSKVSTKTPVLSIPGHDEKVEY